MNADGNAGLLRLIEAIIDNHNATNQELADTTERSVRTVRRQVAWLEQHGALVRHYTPGGRIVYEFNDEYVVVGDVTMGELRLRRERHPRRRKGKQ